ncbi:MAG: hypothetical protein EOO10_02810 [Chitinophagaceae bacterium]|nr:MAG: hypothetical protein EOO10_02810 [Chitinophagaceae bacterium]
MKMAAGILVLLFFCSCQPLSRLQNVGFSQARITGSSFYKTAASFNWKQRDSFAVEQILSGNIPSVLTQLVPVTTSQIDSATGKKITAVFYVTPDYLSIGTNEDWARVPLTPMAAQRLADRFNCFLPTRKMVDAIYHAAKVKLEPVPLYAFRDSSPTMYHHHLIIEGQRRGQSGLIAGIKKDVVISGKISRDAKPNRVAIYGWHKPDGKPIQPLYTGHVNWYVDYSHGIRLVYRKIKLNGQWMDYTEILTHPVYQKLLCDEPWCDFFQYSHQ